MPSIEQDQAELLELIHRSRISVWMMDFETYQNCFIQAPTTERWNASPVTGIHVRRGWDEIAARAKAMFREFADNNQRNNAYNTKVLDLNLHIHGDMAWATYRQAYPETAPPPGMAPTLPWHHAGPSPSHEMRVFQRQDGHWRICFMTFLDPDPIRASVALLRLGEDGTILWQSEVAARLMASDDDLVVRNGRLRIRDTKTDARLQSAIKWAARISAPLSPGRGALPIVMQAGEGVPAKVWWVSAEGGSIYFVLGDPAQDEHRLEAAAIVYSLSAAQKQVATHVVAGRTLGEIADAMGITANTARTHLGRVFDKTGVRTQSELVRVLLSAAAPF